MLEEWLIRFVLGGLLVSAFSVLGDLFRPKTLAGVFAAAPSVALAGLGLAFVSKGAEYAAVETRSMLLGAAALGCYSYLVARLLLRRAGPTLLVSSVGLGMWFVVACGLWALFLRGQQG
jgi:Protein of unknown function (DUF3147)